MPYFIRLVTFTEKGICTSSGCRNYSFMSSADKARYYRLGHGRKRGIERKDKTPKFTCDICSVSFVTQWS